MATKPAAIDVDAEQAAWDEIESTCGPTVSGSLLDVDPNAAAMNRRYGYNGLRRVLFCARNYVPEDEREAMPLTQAIARECHDWKWSSMGILEKSIETHARYATVGMPPAERVRIVACLTTAIGAVEARRRFDAAKS